MTKGTFGLRLRGFRKKKGLTIEQLAERVGLSTNYLGDVERGKKLPSMATLIRIVNVLDISADELLKDDVNRADYLVDAEISARMANLTQRQRVAVLRMLDSILKEIPNLTDRTWDRIGNIDCALESGIMQIEGIQRDRCVFYGR